VRPPHFPPTIARMHQLTAAHLHPLEVFYHLPVLASMITRNTRKLMTDVQARRARFLNFALYG